MRDAGEPIALENVWKIYGRITALAGLTISVPAGSVYGFLGPNGAGKSTAIRLILGLQRADRGEVRLFGRRLAEERAAMLRSIGSLVEAPSIYLHLTGRENLAVHTRMLGLPERAADEALETVGLPAVAKQLAQNYSTGMKQRLGIATALLGNPELLVLDEPSNGLDPGGIHEVRMLLRDLPRRRGVTVFLSSHLLAEVEQVATHLAIISQGQVKFEGTQRELQAQSAPAIAVEADRPERAMELLASTGCAASRDGNRISVAVAGDWDAARINTMLVGAGIAVSHLAVEQPTLEDLFLDLTGSEMDRGLATR